MTKTTISFFEIEKWEEKYLVDNFKKVKNLSLNFFSKPLSLSILKKIKNTNILAVFIYSQVDGNRIGFVTEIVEKEGLDDLLYSMETTMKESFSPLISFIDREDLNAFLNDKSPISDDTRDSLKYYTELFILDDTK